MSKAQVIEWDESEDLRDSSHHVLVKYCVSLRGADILAKPCISGVFIVWSTIPNYSETTSKIQLFPSFYLKHLQMKMSFMGYLKERNWKTSHHTEQLIGWAFEDFTKEAQIAHE